MGKEEIRKGPWSENEDVKLVMYVKLFGDRRWDFIAQVSGLKRSGKSCRLRWINYLHPGLRGGKMTPQEQLLVLQLHSKWGNRWSRIASHLPGRTDNEIKNYWRTYTRKKAQKERKHAIYNKLSPNLWQTSSTSTSRSTQSISCSCHVVAPTLKARPIQTETTGESMENNLNTSSSSNKLMTMAMGSSPSSMWDSLWNMDWEEINKLAFTTQQYPSTNHN